MTWKKASGGPYVAYEELVEEALCFGWIDSRSGAVDHERTRLWMAPRRRGSGWSGPNKERVERLLATGRLAEPGLRAIERARADGSWSALDDVEALVVPGDLADALAAHPPAAEVWEAFGRSAKRGLLEWIATAKRPETRARRIAETAEQAARGEQANRWRPPASRS